MKNTTTIAAPPNFSWITICMILLLPACYQTEDLLPIDQPMRHDIVPQGTYQATPEGAESSLFEMIIRSSDVSDSKYIISNFADLHVDAIMYVDRDILILEQQSLGHHQGVEHLILGGSMLQTDEHRFNIAYQMKEGNVTVDRLLPVLFLGPCE